MIDGINTYRDGGTTDYHSDIRPFTLVTSFGHPNPFLYWTNGEGKIERIKNKEALRNIEQEIHNTFITC